MLKNFKHLCLICILGFFYNRGLYSTPLADDEEKSKADFKKYLECLSAKINSDPTSQTPHNATAFISYSSDEASHRTRVKNLANYLLLSGVLDQIEMDVWSNTSGNSIPIPRFISRIGSVPIVLLIGSPSLKSKYELSLSEGKGILNYEIDLIITRTIENGNKGGIIPIWFSGKLEENFPFIVRPLVSEQLPADNLSSYHNNFFKLLINISTALGRNDKTALIENYFSQFKQNQGKFENKQFPISTVSNLPSTSVSPQIPAKVNPIDLTPPLNNLQIRQSITELLQKTPKTYLKPQEKILLTNESQKHTVEEFIRWMQDSHNSGSLHKFTWKIRPATLYPSSLFVRLGMAFQKAIHLKEIELSHIELDDLRLKALLELLESSDLSNLKLSLHGNLLTDKALKPLIRFMYAHRHGLEELDLSHNKLCLNADSDSALPTLTYDILGLKAAIFASESLKKLNLEGNPLWEKARSILNPSKIFSHQCSIIFSLPNHKLINKGAEASIPPCKNCEAISCNNQSNSPF